jgi:FlaG/FlaF family flagellin (archaellin)
MVAITVILAAVIAAFVFGIGGQQSAAPTASIVAANNPDTSTYGRCSDIILMYVT